MAKERLLAFSDGVLAIIITIMVLEMKAPHGSSLSDLKDIVPIFLSYVLSFVYVAIYWNNHHHMMHTVTRVNGAVLWANTNLLFWLSLIPFATAWMGENHFEAVPTALYGAVMLMPALAYKLLQTLIIRLEGPDCLLAKAVGSDSKGWVSPLLFLAAIPLAFVSTWLAHALFVAVAVMWFIPDRRIEEQVVDEPANEGAVIGEKVEKRIANPDRD